MNDNKEKPRKATNYTSIIKDSKKFYVSINDNIQFLLSPNELAIFLKVIKIEKTGKTTNTYNLNLEVIQGIYSSLNSIKEIEGKQKWCEIYIQNVASRGAEFTPQGGAKNACSGVQNLHVRGAKIALEGVQNLHPNKEDI